MAMKHSPTTPSISHSPVPMGGERERALAEEALADPNVLREYKRYLNHDIDESRKDNKWLQREHAHVKAQNENLRTTFISFMNHKDATMLRDVNEAEKVANSAKHYNPKKRAVRPSAPILPPRPPSPVRRRDPSDYQTPTVSGAGRRELPHSKIPDDWGTKARPPPVDTAPPRPHSPHHSPSPAHSPHYTDSSRGGHTPMFANDSDSTDSDSDSGYGQMPPHSPGQMSPNGASPAHRFPSGQDFRSTSPKSTVSASESNYSSVQNTKAAIPPPVHSVTQSQSSVTKPQPQPHASTGPPASVRNMRPHRPNDSDQFITGTLDVTIHEARDLPNGDAGFFNNMVGDKSDSYVRILIDETKGPQTKVIDNDLHPKWEENFIEYLSGHIQKVVFQVNDKDSGGSKQALARLVMPAQQFTTQNCSRQWFELENMLNPGKGKKTPGLCLSTYWHGREECKQDQVPRTKFPLHKKNVVKLYQDAHADGCGLAPVPIGLGTYKNHNAWEDLYDGIMAAKHFIYITGWSVYTEIKMRRGPNDGHTLTIGEMLKKKAAEGVKVLMMVWNDATSIDNAVVNNLFAVTKAGVVSTFDEDTYKFFKGTPVVCELVSRAGSGVGSKRGKISALSSTMGYIANSAVFTHHQKSVMFDAPVSSNQPYRKILAYIGGLDLTNGRFDDPTHPLFKTLNTLHKGDYYQGYGSWADTIGPRQPWHDIHGFLEGPAARDIVTNFEDRWHKQVTSKVGELVAFTSLPILTPEQEEMDLGGIPPKEAWSVQFFRSIDDSSAIRTENNFDNVEFDIQKAYIHYIRKAERFIYIENQYFLGSSTDWEEFHDKNFNIECKHRIPAEIANKIVDKIRHGELFCAYIVIPMHPEGIPEDAPLQAILFWQFNTVKMMYQKVQGAIDDAKRAGHAAGDPFDYLQVFFPGRREPEFNIDVTGLTDERQISMVKNKRQMIYVHSKMIIVDDEWILLGSANINERSMAGDRDTEMAFGATQKAYQQSVSGRRADGQISGFRLSLWAEHWGKFDPDFLYPESQECARKTRAIGEANWQAFNSNQNQSMPSGHACNYPYQFSNGMMSTVQEHFTDMGTNLKKAATIKGVQPAAHLNLLTT